MNRDILAALRGSRFGGFIAKPLIDMYCVYGSNLAHSCRAVATLDF